MLSSVHGLEGVRPRCSASASGWRSWVGQQTFSFCFKGFQFPICRILCFSLIFFMSHFSNTKERNKKSFFVNVLYPHKHTTNRADVLF